MNETIPPTNTYINKLKRKCKAKYGSRFIEDNEELIEIAARNKRLLDRCDLEMEDAKLVVLGESKSGSKSEINPLAKYRNETAKLLADNLDALQLTERARYKKADAPPPADEADNFYDILQQANG